MPKLLGFDVGLEVDGTRLAEFKEEWDYSSGIPIVTCWVPSEAGKVFKISMAPPPPPRDTHWSFSLKLDGVVPTVMSNTLYKNHATNPKVLSEILTSEKQATSVRFSTLELTDDDALMNAGAAAHLGEVRVFMYSVEEFVSRTASLPINNVEFAGRVHERAKKGLAHCISTGEARTAAPTWIDAVGKNLEGTVVFKYRNIDILVAEGIAPRRPTPAKVEAEAGRPDSNAPAAVAGPSTKKAKKRKTEDGSGPKVKIEIDVEEELRLEQEARDLEARLAAVRAKIGQHNPNKRVKTEVKEEEPSRSPFVHGEIIDLTI